MSRHYFLKTDRLGFSIWSPADLPLAMALWGDTNVSALIGGPFTEQQVEERLEGEIACIDNDEHAANGSRSNGGRSEWIVRSYCNLGLNVSLAANTLEAAIHETRQLLIGNKLKLTGEAYACLQADTESSRSNGILTSWHSRQRFDTPMMPLGAH